MDVMMTIKRTTNWSEEGSLHVEVTEDPIEQITRRTDRRTDRQTNLILTYNWTSLKGLRQEMFPYLCTTNTNTKREGPPGFGSKPFASFVTILFLHLIWPI